MRFRKFLAAPVLTLTLTLALAGCTPSAVESALLDENANPIADSTADDSATGNSDLVGEIVTVSSSGGGTPTAGGGTIAPPAEDLIEGEIIDPTARVAQLFPESIALDISELPDDSTDPGAKNAPQVTEYLGIRRTLAASATIIGAFHNLADRSLALARRISIDMSDPAQVQVQGTFFADLQPVLYKADFAAFDVDGDGVSDGSGNAVDLPVAVRIWTDRGEGYTQFLCALITTKPSLENLGAGRMFVRPNAARADAYADFQFQAVWDRTDAAHKWNEAYLTGQVAPQYAMSIGYKRVDTRTYADESVEKTVRSNSSLTMSYAGFEEYNFASHFRRFEPYVLLDAESSGGALQISLEDMCVDLMLGQVNEAGACDGFDLTDFTPLAEPGGDEPMFPAAFPAEPTF